jgi:hypothetical protein
MCFVIVVSYIYHTCGCDVNLSHNHTCDEVSLPNIRDEVKREEVWECDG